MLRVLDRRGSSTQTSAKLARGWSALPTLDRTQCGPSSPDKLAPSPFTQSAQLRAGT